MKFTLSNACRAVWSMTDAQLRDLLEQIEYCESGRDLQDECSDADLRSLAQAELSGRAYSARLLIND